MEIGVVPDIVAPHRADYIETPARFQHSRLLAHHFERCTHAQLIEIGGDAQGGIIRRGSM